MNKAEVSQSNEGLNVEQLQIPNGVSTSRRQAQQERERGTRVGLFWKVRKCMQTIDAILSAGNLTEASREVIRNKGAAGVDAMNVKELRPYLDKHRDELTALIRQGEYCPQPIRGKEIPKGSKKKRLLGIYSIVRSCFISFLIYKS
ncbi:hypothetical protein [Gaoshiqia sp. Z1-71]|uniref:hypothetical protein n=1 Tax=Gaoshiqia hydrogeniformans TaxID=3290090 RepID=UPI003BF8B1CD